MLSQGVGNPVSEPWVPRAADPGAPLLWDFARIVAHLEAMLIDENFMNHETDY